MSIEDDRFSPSGDQFAKRSFFLIKNPRPRLCNEVFLQARYAPVIADRSV